MFEYWWVLVLMWVSYWIGKQIGKQEGYSDAMKGKDKEKWGF